MPRILELDHVQLAAPPGCVAAARRFFVDLLGLAELERPAELANQEGCWFAVGSRQFHIGVQPLADFHPAKKAHPAFTVEDLDGLAQRLESAGHACKWDLAIPGVRRFFAHDPWGNRLEFIEAPPV